MPDISVIDGSGTKYIQIYTCKLYFYQSARFLQDHAHLASSSGNGRNSQQAADGNLFLLLVGGIIGGQYGSSQCADVLKFFIIRLYRNGVKVFENAADNNNAVSAGLIGDSGNKIRISVNTNQEFDAIELWTGGVLNLNLNAFRIYYAFWESASANCYSTSALNSLVEV